MTKRKKLSTALALLNNSSSEWSPTQLSVAPAAWYVMGEGVNEDLSSNYTNDYVFNASLKSSLVLDRGTGDPTFTRASTAYVVDFEGLYKQVLSGEARFTGARRVANGVRNSASCYNATWTKQGDSAVAANGDVTWTFAGTGFVYDSGQTTVPGRPGQTLVLSATIYSTGAATKVNWRVDRDGLPQGNGADLTISTSPVRYSRVVTLDSGTAIPVARFDCASTNGGGVNIAEIQLEDVTGQSNQNPSEYVSVGVLSAPYHGAGVDGVKYFQTENGNTVASNVVTEATGAAIADATLKGYLAEGARTNCVLHSSGGTTDWTTSATLTANYASAFGLSFVRFVQAAPNDYAIPALSGHADGAATISAYFKQDGSAAGTFNFVLWDSVHGAAFSAAITVAANGVITAVQNAGTLLGCESVGGGVYRISGTGTDNFATDGANFYAIANSAIASVQVGGCQWEAASFASSYIPTTTAAVTRAADVLTYPTSGNFSNTAGTVYCEFNVPVVPTAAAVLVADSVGSASPIYINASNAIGYYDGTNLQSLCTTAAVAGSSRKAVTAWSGSRINGALQGTLGIQNNYDGGWGLTAIAIGESQGGANNLFGNIRNVKIWTAAVPQYVLQTLTGGSPPSSALTAQWVNDQSGNERVLEQSTAANRPIILPYSGTPYAYLPGVGGNYFSTPDSAAAGITGDIDVRVYAALNNWNTGDYQDLIGKCQDGTKRSYWLGADNAGKLVFSYGTDGTSFVSLTSSVVHGLTAGQLTWVRVTRNATTGVGKFYLSTDGSTWTQLGADVVGATGAMFDSVSVVEVGSIFAGTIELPAGKLYRAQIYNGIDGTLVVDFNPSTFAETSTNGATAVASTGETWTLNSTGAKPAQIVKSASLLFDGTDDYMKTAAFTLNQPTTIYLAHKPIAWAANCALLDGFTGDSMLLQQRVGSPQFIAYAGTILGPINGPAIGAKGIVAAVFNGNNGVIQLNAGAATTGAVGAANGGGITLGGDGGSPATTFTNIQVYELIAFPAAHTAAERLLVQRYLANKYSIVL